MADNNENKVLNVPHLRFPEFSEEWEICKVSELLDFYSTNSLSWEQLEYGTKAIMNLHYGLIHVGLPTMVDLTRDNLPNIKEDNMPKNFELCKEGDVAFADASEDTNEVAKPIEFFDLAGKNIVCGLHTIHGRDNKNKTVVGFKGYAFSSSAFHNQIRRIAQGTKIYSISTKNFSECYVGIPSKAEQTKIATLLRLIDERIATQNKIIEDLKKLKSAISQLLLFKSDLLEKRIPLSEVSALKNGYPFLSSSYDSTGEYEVLTIANVTGERYICSEGCNRILTKPSDIQFHQTLKANDILISLTGNVGRVSLCKEGKYLLNQRVGLLQLNSAIVREFIYQVLSSRDFEQSMISCSQGAAQMNIGKGDVENYIIPYSGNPKNLLKISSALNSFDTKTLTESRILQLLNRQKSHLLTSLFI